MRHCGLDNAKHTAASAKTFSNKPMRRWLRFHSQAHQAPTGIKSSNGQTA